MSTEKAAASGIAALLAASVLGAQEIPPLPPPGIELPHVVLVSVGGEIATNCGNRLDLAGCESAGETFAPETWTRDLPDLGLVARIATEDLRAFSRADGGAARSTGSGSRTVCGNSRKSPTWTGWSSRTGRPGSRTRPSS